MKILNLSLKLYKITINTQIYFRCNLDIAYHLITIYMTIISYRYDSLSSFCFSIKTFISMHSLLNFAFNDTFDLLLYFLD